MEINKTYKIRVNLRDREFCYTGTIIANVGGFVTFRDKFGKVFGYNLNNVVGFEELDIEEI